MRTKYLRKISVDNNTVIVYWDTISLVVFHGSPCSCSAHFGNRCNMMSDFFSNINRIPCKYHQLYEFSTSCYSYISSLYPSQRWYVATFGLMKMATSQEWNLAGFQESKQETQFQIPAGHHFHLTKSYCACYFSYEFGRLALVKVV